MARLAFLLVALVALVAGSRVLAQQQPQQPAAAAAVAKKVRVSVSHSTILSLPSRSPVPGTAPESLPGVARQRKRKILGNQDPVA